MTRRLAAILLTLLAITLATACSSDDDTSESAAATEAPASATEASTSGGSVSGASTSSAPELGDFDVPLPEWADAVSVDNSGPLKVVQFIVPLDQQAATVAFYDDWTAGQPETYLRTEGEGSGVTLQTESAPGAEKTIISVLSPLDGDDFVAVTVSRGTFE